MTGRTDVPYGFCHCGCGGLAPLAQHTDARRGYVAGEPHRFIQGHNARHPTLSERLWAKVEKNGPPSAHRPDLGPCWLWTGALDPKGYGRIGDRGATRLVHRVAYELVLGSIPDDLPLDHLCRVSGCVNPAHLEPVTSAENTRRGLGGVLKTHCKNGHPWIPENITMTGPDRTCAICRYLSSRRGHAAYRQRKAAERMARRREAPT